MHEATDYLIIHGFILLCYWNVFQHASFLCATFAYWLRQLHVFNWNLVKNDVLYNLYLFISLYRLKFFHFREEMAMKIGLTEARIQVRRKRYFTNITAQNVYSEKSQWINIMFIFQVIQTWCSNEHL